jgi:CxxC motif-containing protein
MEKELVCIVCPIGCRLKITGENGNIEVTGNQCKRGISYARDEITNPTRMICSTVRIRGGVHKVLPVKTDKAIPEKYKFEVIRLINKIELTSPVRMGDVIIADVFGTGVNIVATRNM